MTDKVIVVDSFIAYTIGIVVYFVGMRLNARISFLRTYNIPEPVTGGILVALVTLCIYIFADIEIQYDLATRDRLLVYFLPRSGSTHVSLTSCRVGRPLATLLLLTLGYIVLQDVVGVLMAYAIGQPSAMGLLTGSASLIGGHGTAIAWAPEIAADRGHRQRAGDRGRLGDARVGDR